MIRDEALRALGDPTDRSPGLARGPAGERIFGMRSVLEPKAAADIGRHNADLVVRHLEDRSRKLSTESVRSLKASIDDIR